MLLAGLFSGVTFGWHHYTGEPDSHQWAWVTIPVMWINLLNFLVTRNFQLTVLLHNAIAAVGFTEQQYSQVPFKEWQDPATYQTPFYTSVFIVSFTLPYLLLNVLEWWATVERRVDGVPAEAPIAAREPRPSEAS
jgi:hypothetical protein